MTTGNDNPIRDAEDDFLHRFDVSQSFARQVLSLDASEGMVVGVLGPWGSGKTSFVNLARIHWKAENITMLDFNPWMFSGAEQLVGSFFVELASQLKVNPKLCDVANAIEDYGETFSGLGWLPLVGPWIERGRGVARILTKLLIRRKEGIGERRANLVNALSALDHPIVVVLDDIDRLTTDEIRDVFKLIRLTASFPNLIYVVAFDRTRVEHALAEQGLPGTDYLEKILQVAIDLPAIPTQVLNRQIFESLHALLSKIENPGAFDEQAWPDLFVEVISPLIRNMRDVRRYAMAIEGTIEALGGQIAIADVLALEAVRVFLPNVFRRMHKAIEALTSTSDFRSGGSLASSSQKDTIQSLLKAAGEHEEVVRAMIQRLFPAGQKHIGGPVYGADFKRDWLRTRRVAHDEILRFYIERVTGESFQAFVDAETAFALMSNPEELDRFLRSLDPECLEEVISSLEIYEDKYIPDNVVPGITVLLNILPDLPDRQRGMFEFGPRITVGRITLRLLKALDDPVKREAAVTEILPKLKLLSSKLELISDVGYVEGVGHKLVSEDAATKFEVAWSAEVRGASSVELADEGDLVRVLIMAKKFTPITESAPVIPNDPMVTFAILRSARSETMSRPMDSRAIRRSPRLAWDVLVELFGDQNELEHRIENLKTSGLFEDDELLSLVDKYLGGWRPKDFGED